MLNIVVCEDNKVQRERITQIIENTIIRDKLDMKIALSTGKPGEVIEYIKNPSSESIYFLDIDLKSNINGIKLGEMIKDVDPNGFIIFVTTHSELSLLTFQYKVEAMDYIIKDNYSNIKDRINQCIEKAIKRYNMRNKDEKVLHIDCDERVINIKLDEILFLETSDKIHKVKVHELNRHLEFYGSLKEIEKSLDERFSRCHRSFIVNRDKIKEIDKKNRILYMINDEECYVSTRYLKNLIK